MTRVEVYLENTKLYIFEKVISPQEATEELQDFISTLAAQLQTLNRIEF